MLEPRPAARPPLPPVRRPSAPAPPTPEDPTIFDLSFTEQTRYRPCQVVAPEFVAAKHPATPGVRSLTRDSTSPAAPFAAVELDVPAAATAPDRDAGGTYAAGLATEDGDHVLVTFEQARRRVAIEVRTGGRTRQLRRRTVDAGVVAGGFTLAFALCENQVTALVRGRETRAAGDSASGGWRPVITERDKVAALLDLRRPETLARHSYAWGARPGPGGDPVDVDGVRAGLFGMVGVRDPHLVQDSEGRPHVVDGRVYLTMTCAGIGFFQQAHWGVFSLALDDPTDLRQVAQLFTHRDGMVLGDHAGQLVRDGDRWLVGTSSWGDFEPGRIHVRHVVTTDDLLSGVHLLTTERTALPTTVGSWDPGMTRIDGRWHLSFVESPSQDPFDFHPALATTSSDSPYEDLRLVGAAEDLHQCEGPVIARADDAWWLLASDGDHRDYPVFDLSMRRVGRLHAPYPTNIPHPQILRSPDGRHLMLTFDGTPFHSKVIGYGGHGDLVVMASG